MRNSQPLLMNTFIDFTIFKNHRNAFHSSGKIDIEASGRALAL